MEHLRTLQEIDEDGLWPREGGLESPDPETLREQALHEVLGRIPPDDYARLKNMADSFVWFLPHERTRGMVYPFFATVFPRRRKGQALVLKPHSKVLYLSPILERTAWEVTVGVVAHEISHIISGHDLLARPVEYETQEREAWDRVRKWGFGREARKAMAVHRWWESWDKYRVKMLLKAKRKKQSKGGG